MPQKDKDLRRVSLRQKHFGHTCFLLVLAWFVALRVVAQPFALAAPTPGLIALCAGGQVVYISTQTGQTTTGDDVPQQVTCPFFGGTAGITPDPIDPVVWQAGFAVVLLPTKPGQTTLHRDKLRPEARAPPVFS